MKAERFDVSPVCETWDYYLPVDVGYQCGDAVGGDQLGPFFSLRLPFSPIWIETRGTALGLKNLPHAGVFMRERPERGGWRIQADVVWHMERGRCWVDEPQCMRHEGNPSRVVEPWTGERATMPAALLSALALLHSRNVSTVIVEPPGKLQAKRARNNRPALFTYRELTVKIGKAPHRPIRELLVGSHRDLAYHGVRAHWMHFSPERPAFGRIARPLWCPPHFRGNRDHGVVEKDYRVDAHEPKART